MAANTRTRRPLARGLGLVLIIMATLFVSPTDAYASYANRLASSRGLQGRVMWIDADANLWELSTRAGVADTVAKCKSANINTIIVDVKPLSGYVLYNSSIAPKLDHFLGKRYPKDYDLLATMVELGHAAGIQVHAAINVFSEGSQKVPGGPAYQHPEWQCVTYEVDRFIVAADGSTVPVGCSISRESSSVSVFVPGSEPTTDLPRGTFYVRVSGEGRVLQSGEAVGKARLSAPENGYLLVATGAHADYAKQMIEAGRTLELMGKGALRSVSSIGNVHNAVFVNPLHPDVRAYELSIVEEICRNYAVDGIVLDRMRYPNIYADFSELSRKAFEQFTDSQVTNWPEDVFVRRPAPCNDVSPGPLFRDWLRFRAQVMRTFLQEARDKAKSVRPEALVGIYVGSWYPLYYDVGVNWGSPAYRASYDWWPEGYEETGYADLVDYMCTGCYYSHPTRAEARRLGEEEWKSVEAAAEESVTAVKDATLVYGSLFLQQYNGRPQRFAEAMRQCLEKTQGCMLFDLVYVRDYDWWQVLRDVFPTPAAAPHNDKDLVDRLRHQHEASLQERRTEAIGQD